MNIKRANVIAKINFKQTTWIAYLVAGLSFLNSLVQIFIYYLLDRGKKEPQVSEGNMLLLVIIIAAVLIPTVNFTKIMHINGKKRDFFWGSFLNYIIFSAVISILNLIFLYTFDSVMGSALTIWNLSNLFGWTANGILITFFRQFAFYLLLGVVIHTLTSMQTFWFGWVVDLVIAAIISVFTPIAPLRAVLVNFFNIIIFNPNALAHIGICLALSAAIYALNLPILSRKKI